MDAARKKIIVENFNVLVAVKLELASGKPEELAEAAVYLRGAAMGLSIAIGRGNYLEIETEINAALAGVN